MRFRAMISNVHAVARWHWMSINRERVSRLLREGGWIGAGQVATILGSLALVRVLTEYLKPVQYGELALGLTVAGLINQTVMGGIGGGIGRYFVIAVEKQDLRGYLHSSWRLLGYAALCVVAIAVALVVGLVAVGQARWVWLTLAAMIFALASGLNATMNGIQNAARQRQVVAFHSGLDSWLKIALAVGVMYVAGASSTAVIIGYSLSSLFVTASQLMFLRRLVRARQLPVPPSERENWMRQIWLYSWPFSTWGLFTWAQTSSDRWSLQFFASTASVGQYAVLYQLGFAPISLGSTLLTTFLSPIMYQRAGDARDHSRVAVVYQSTTQVAVIVLSATVVGALAFAVLHKWIFALLVTPRFASYSYLLPWMAIAAGFQACHHVLGIRISSLLRTQMIILPQIASAVVFTALNMLGAYLGGTQGLVYSVVVSSLLYATWMLVLTEYLRRRSHGLQDQTS